MCRLKDELLHVIRSLNVKIDDEQIHILDRGIPHKLTKLNEDYMVVYTFAFQERYLKIGKAGPKSFARVNSHHYNPNSSNSNLSKSMLSDRDFCSFALTEESIKDWIKNNTARLDILMEKRLGIFVLNFVEAFLHLKFQPKYEGFETQRFT